MSSVTAYRMQLTCRRLTIIEFAFGCRADVLINDAKHKFNTVFKMPIKLTKLTSIAQTSV